MELSVMIATALLIADSGFDNHMGDWGAGWWILMAFMMVAFWGLVIGFGAPRVTPSRFVLLFGRSEGALDHRLLWALGA
jgi:hypothetical protein